MKRYNVSFPDNDQDFETLCCAIAKEKYADYNAQQYGRSGQKQWGIDIKATNKKGKQEKIVIQCKYKNDPPKFSGSNADRERKDIKQEMEHELKQALGSPSFNFDVFIYAATIPNDTQIEDFAKVLEIKYQKEVIVWTITTIEQDIRFYPRLTRLYTESGKRFGVELIDKDFIDSLEQKIWKGEYSPSVFKFYTGTQTQYEQWCGLLQKWDAPRQSVEVIENQLNRLFALPYIQAKVAAVVYGEGGSGKSTLLRRIAIDCIQKEKPYTIWWVESIDVFLEFDAQSIEAAHRQKHLIIIDDWYRNVGLRNKERANDFFTWLKNIDDNVLVLIGDRQNHGFYREYVYENKTYQLLGSENQSILEHIARESIELQPIVAEIKAKQTLIDHSSLFVILYVIAHTFEEKTTANQFDLGNIESTFKTIIHDKLMSLEANDRYKGLGKAIYLCAKIYADEDLSYFIFSSDLKLSVVETLGTLSFVI